MFVFPTGSAAHLLMIAFITWDSSLVPLVYVAQIHVDLNSQFFSFGRNRTDDLGIGSPALWPNELALHRLGSNQYHGTTWGTPFRLLHGNAQEVKEKKEGRTTWHADALGRKRRHRYRCRCNGDVDADADVDARASRCTLCLHAQAHPHIHTYIYRHTRIWGSFVLWYLVRCECKKMKQNLICCVEVTLHWVHPTLG